MEKRKDVREHKNHTERDGTQKEREKKEREREQERASKRSDDGAQRATDTVQQKQQKSEGLGSGVSALPC